MKLVIVNPCYNEKENLRILYPRLFKVIENFDLDVDVVVVDDSSPDGTADFVKNQMKLYPNLFLVSRPEKSGLGSAYIDGFRYGIEILKADFVMSMDADLSHPPELLNTFAIEAKKYDIVIGSRYIPGGDFKNWPWIRKAISRGANIFGQTILGLSVKDISSGYRLYSANIWRRIKFESVKTNGYCTLEEILYLAKKKNARIKEIPLIFVDREIGETKLTMKEGIKFFTSIIKLRFKG
jgi:dolichol-phosphate mannosyltransferase